MTASVKYVRPEVAKLKPIYQKIRDVLAGPSAVKAAGKTYLPVPDPTDDSDANKERYKQYKERAQFFDATSRTHEGYIGQIFYRDPQIDLPELLSVLLVDVDGTGVGLEQQAKQAAEDVLPLGRGGLYVDYSNRPGANTSRLEQERFKVRPTISYFAPENIPNWRWTVVGDQKYLSLVVLEEKYDSDDDGYQTQQSTQWRELRLVWPERDEQGQPVGEPVYTCTIWREGSEGLVQLPTTMPTRGDGKPWNYIPFYFIGSKNNDPTPDRPPFEGLAELNIGHYRNSADYEESVFMVGQPTPWASGITENWLKEAWNNELRLGSREFIPLPEGGSMGLLQPTPNLLAKEAMEMKERQMVALGAKLAEQKQVQATATQTNKESVIENSTLSTVSQNVSSAYQLALQDCAIYSNVPSDKIVFELNTDFEITRMTAQDRQQLLAEWQGGGITWEEYRWNMKRSGVAYEDDAKAKNQIEADQKDSLDLDKEDPPEDDQKKKEPPEGE